MATIAAMSEIVRPSRPEQIEQLRTLFREYQRWVDEPVCFAGFERELAELPNEYRVLLLAEAGGAPAGCVGLRVLPDGAAEMKRLYVRPAFQGRGLGRRLAGEIIAAARASGYAALRLDTLPKMAPAIALYRALGFSPRGPYAAAPAPGALFFELRL
jgi:ribosomal protein S18 acetylase RimI-like enzyme